MTWECIIEWPITETLSDSSSSSLDIKSKDRTNLCDIDQAWRVQSTRHRSLGRVVSSSQAYTTADQSLATVLQTDKSNQQQHVDCLLVYLYRFHVFILDVLCITQKDTWHEMYAILSCCDKPYVLRPIVVNLIARNTLFVYTELDLWPNCKNDCVAILAQLSFNWEGSMNKNLINRTIGVDPKKKKDHRQTEVERLILNVALLPAPSLMNHHE